MLPLHVNVIRLIIGIGKNAVRPSFSCSKPNFKSRLGLCTLRKGNGNYVLLCIVLLNVKWGKNLTYTVILILLMTLCLISAGSEVHILKNVHR